MDISKTTINMARKRGVHFEIREGDTFARKNATLTTLEICGMTDGEAWDEYHALYEIKEDGLHFVMGCFDTQEWPNWIESDSHLRGLLNPMAEAIEIDR